MSRLTDLMSMLNQAGSIPRLVNSFYASLLLIYSMKPTYRFVGFREWASLREKSDYDRTMLVARSRERSLAENLRAK